MKDDNLPFDLAKLKKAVTWKFRGFLAGLVLSVLAVGFGAYAIHPGLAIMVLSSAVMYFFHVNAKMMDETLIRLRQAEMILAQAPPAPGGYH